MLKIDLTERTENDFKALTNSIKPKRQETSHRGLFERIEAGA